MKSRRSCLNCIVWLILLPICLGAILAPLVLIELPRRTEQTFGPPAESLVMSRRIYLSAVLLLESNDLTTPANPMGSLQPFKVELGESTSSVIRHLGIQGFIRNPEAFRAYLQYSGLDTSLQAGEYQLSPSMTSLEIARALQDATPSHVTFSVLAGWRLEEIAASLPTSGLSITPELFMEATASPPQGYQFSFEFPQGASLEGFLAPGTYQLSRDLTTDELINILLNNFEAHLTPELLEGFKRQGLSVYEAVTLASILQRETVVANEMPLIASVFYNRLEAGMNLETDPTVQYALGFNSRQRTWWTNPLSSEDLAVHSAYNTYLHPGLPPGPIATPSLTALQAVAFPAQSPYYYFRSACDGSGKHVFSETYAEHVSKGCP